MSARIASTDRFADRPADKGICVRNDVRDILRYPLWDSEISVLVDVNTETLRDSMPQYKKAKPLRYYRDFFNDKILIKHQSFTYLLKK